MNYNELFNSSVHTLVSVLPAITNEKYFVLTPADDRTYTIVTYFALELISTL